MTLNVRRILLNTLLVPGFIAFILVAVAWIGLSEGFYPAGTASADTATWWSILRESVATDTLWALAGISFLVVVPLAWELILRRRFGRSPSPEMFFFRLFLLTLPLQAVRIVIPPALNGTIDIIWAQSATRMAWFVRLLGVSVLMNVGLYSGELPFRRSGAILGAGALAAVAIAVVIPLDVTQPLGNLLLRPGTDASLSLICVAVELLAVLTLVGSARTRQKSRYYLLAGSLFVVVAGTEMLFFVSTPLLVPGAAAFLAGGMGFVRETGKIYQWI